MGLRSVTAAGRYAASIKDEDKTIDSNMKHNSTFSIPGIESTSGGQGSGFVRPSTANANKIQY